ncbi:hypothetical protein OIE13_22640 [Streptosporangium sp. NBC_01810]|uniref:hypothetical protein n=1 Tax=Streptosporangium sp. NBC_01810 TaxID=2975951 RepID=UPI002DD85841|nr:hypothetical protein [Streptosporangium sp. NBC_01810]WSA23743.1 hypothetical protein OIE13_22640 [Streptosporangium sp. NBC_01810]
MNSARKEVNQLIRDARKAGLRAELQGRKWQLTNPETGGRVLVPTQGAGRSLSHLRADLRRLAEPPAPMAAAVAPARVEEEYDVAMPVEELLGLAAKQGVRAEVRGGLLAVSGPFDAEPLARLLRDRSVEVLAHLSPRVESEVEVPKIRDVAHIDIPAPVRNVAGDAQELWRIIRGLAAEQGDEAHPNAGVQGVMWRGALARVVREAMPQWADDYRKDVSVYLERSGHMKCQSRNANPPVWWVRPEWNNGGLTVTKTAAKAKATPKPKTPEPALAAGLADAADPLTMLQAVAKRVSDAETRADDAELMAAMLEEELTKVRGERDEYKAQLDQFRDTFRVLAGGGKA